MLFMLSLLLLPWRSTEPHVEKLGSNVEIGRHWVIAIGCLLGCATLRTDEIWQTLQEIVV